MDSESYPLIDLYCEDDIAAKIISKVINKLQHDHKINNLSDLINIIIAGSAVKTHNYFTYHKETYDFRKIKTGYACVLDGDMKNNFNCEDNLFFLYSEDSPELFLTKKYLENHPNANLQYHVEHSDNHCLFEKMKDLSLGNSKDEAFQLCWQEFETSTDGIIHINDLENFLLKMLQTFSPQL